MSVNKVILVGNAGGDPEIRHLEGGKTVATLSLATNETYKDKDGVKQKNTEWHSIVLWSPFAEVAEKFVKKGSQLYVEGRNATRKYEDKDGVTRYLTEVVCRSLVLLGSSGGSNSTKERADSLAGKQDTPEDDGPPIGQVG